MKIIIYLIIYTYLQLQIFKDVAIKCEVCVVLGLFNLN